MEDHHYWNSVWNAYRPYNQKKQQEYYQLLPFRELPKTARILDIGCGHGDFLQLLKQAGFKHLEGWEPQLDLVKEDVSGLVQPGNCLDSQGIKKKYDVVIIIGVLHHLLGLKEFNQAVKTIYQILKPGGQFFSVEPRGTLIRSIAAQLITYLPTIFLTPAVRLDKILYLHEKKEFEQWLRYDATVTQLFFKNGFKLNWQKKDWRNRYLVFEKKLTSV